MSFNTALSSHQAPFLQSTFLLIAHQPISATSEHSSAGGKQKLCSKETFTSLYETHIELRSLKGDSDRTPAPLKDQILKIPLSRIVGVKIVDDVLLHIYTVAKQIKRQTKGKKRAQDKRFVHLPSPKWTYKRMKWVFKLMDSTEEHKRSLALWHKMLTLDILQGLHTLKQQGSITRVTMEQMEEFQLPYERENGRQRRLLVVINPHSGQKVSKKYFALFVKPVLDVAPLEYETVLTTHANHATAVCQTMNMREFDGIISIGGDGIIFECLQGMMRNPTRNGRLLPIGVIGAGTSNGLATDLGAGHPLVAARIAARGRLKYMDMLSFWQNDQVYYAFLTVTFALVADVDVGTEFLRSLGSVRNIIGGVGCLLRRKMYDGEFKFVSIPKKEENNQDEEQADGAAARTIYAEDPLPAEKPAPASAQPVSSEIAYGTVEQRPHGFTPANSLVPSFLLHYFGEEFKQQCPKWYDHYMKVQDVPPSLQEIHQDNTAEEQQPAPVQAEDEATTTRAVEHSSSSLFIDDVQWKQSLIEKIPKDSAQVFNEKYFYFVATNVNHMSWDMVSSPNAELCNGQIDIIRCTKKASHVKLLKIMAQFEDGTYLESKETHDVMQHDQCVAFVFTPIKKGSFLVLDGEKMAYKTCLVEVHRRVLPVMVNEDCTFTEHLKGDV